MTARISREEPDPNEPIPVVAALKEISPEEKEVEGSLSVFKFPEILQFISNGKRTGLLTITRDDRVVELAFNAGRIVNVASSDRYMHLGQMLVYSGMLTRDALQRALKIQEDSGGEKFLGEVLVEQGLANVEQLKAIIRLQLEEELWELFNWNTGTFRFEQGKSRKTGSIEVDLDVGPLHEEAARRTQEWQALYTSIKSHGDIFMASPDLPAALEFPLNEKVWRVLSLINGQLSVDSLVRLANLGKFETYLALELLLRNDLIIGNNDSATDSIDPKSFEHPIPTSNGSEPKPRNGVKPPAAPTSPKPQWLGLFGRKKITAEPTTLAGPSHQLRVAPSEIKQEYATDVGLACAAINSVLQELEVLSTFAARGSDWVAEIWYSARQRYPRADAIQFCGGRLDAALYESYAKLEGAVTRPLAGAHADALEALRFFWNKLSENAELLLGSEREAAHLLDGIARLYDRTTAAVASPDFSFSRWKELGISPVNGCTAINHAQAQ